MGWAYKPCRDTRMNIAFHKLLLAICLSVVLIPGIANAQDRNFVELEILGDAGTMLESGQKWLEKLSEVGADSVRMNQAGDNARPDVKKTKTSSGASWKITGVISSRGRLLLPGGRYTLRDTDKIKDYIESIRADGAEVALAEKMAFGLTAEQLVALHSDLSPAFETATLGKTPAEILTSVRSTCKTTIVLDESARGALSGDYTLEDELKGLSQGTVLAAALRPLGLVAAPHREQGKPTEIVITDTRRVEEHWPIGWPLQTRPSKSVPKLYERIPVNIKNYTLKATLEAIQKSVEVPFVFDRNSMARTGIDLEEIRVSLEADKLAYQLILDRIVAQARPRVSFDVRVDESGKPFLWFSSR